MFCVIALDLMCERHHLDILECMSVMADEILGEFSI